MGLVQGKSTQARVGRRVRASTIQAAPGKGVYTAQTREELSIATQAQASLNAWRSRQLKPVPAELAIWTLAFTPPWIYLPKGDRLEGERRAQFVFALLVDRKLFDVFQFVISRVVRVGRIEMAQSYDNQQYRRNDFQNGWEFHHPGVPLSQPADGALPNYFLFITCDPAPLLRMLDTRPSQSYLAC